MGPAHCHGQGQLSSCCVCCLSWRCVLLTAPAAFGRSVGLLTNGCLHLLPHKQATLHAVCLSSDPLHYSTLLQATAYWKGWQVLGTPGRLLQVSKVQPASTSQPQDVVSFPSSAPAMVLASAAQYSDLRRGGGQGRPDQQPSVSGRQEPSPPAKVRRVHVTQIPLVALCLAGCLHP